MGQDVKDQWGLAGHRQGGAKIAPSYHAIKMDDDLHAQSPAVTDPDDRDAILEASVTSETAWLNAMPTSVKAWMSSRDSTERGWHRQADQDIRADILDHGGSL